LSARVVKRAPSGFALDVDIAVPPGITVLFGPSGSGKSTALQCIAGLKKPDSGKVALGDDVWFDSTTHRDRAVHERGVGYVFQSLALFPHMSALENVMYGVSRSLDRREIALAMLERMKVAHLAERRPSTFSGGESQRVALARAFASSPRALLLDEAFSAMDRELRRELLLDLRRTVEERPLPVVVVTHMRNEARTVGDRVVLVRDGRVVDVGAVEELLGSAGSGFSRRGQVDED
jgi:molybdate transport system ATP-binding protein